MSTSILDEHYKVHIVDDESIYREILKDILSDGRFELSESSTGKQCLQYLANNTPDIILLDINMPCMDGYEVCKKIKEDSRFKDTPVLFLTAHETPAAIEKGYEVGACDYIIKPFKPSVVKGRVYNRVSSKAAASRKAEVLEIASGKLSI
ncbi:MAG: response regulator [Gammaproteobacteria bacterium]|nr:MAG: response regulator [Gammaproteobacteria bacterium]